MPEPMAPSTGLGVLHLFCHRPRGRTVDRGLVAAAVKAAPGEGRTVVPVAILGHKADLGFMALGADLWRLRALQAELQDAGLELSQSYLSLTEVSEYAKGVPEELKRARLYPDLPPAGMRAFCFYPMTKRRNPGQNWYTLAYEDRERLMHGHGATGRSFRGRVVQLITGSTGLDDYEWGVTLFARAIDDLKEVVYTMRFDEGSALYAEFGPFYTGLVGDLDEVLDAAGIR